MKVDIYRAKKSLGRHEKLYIFVPADSNIEELPNEIHEKTGGLVPVKTIDIQLGEKRIALNADEALKNLEEKGYHEQGSKIKVVNNYTKIQETLKQLTKQIELINNKIRGQHEHTGNNG